MVVPKNLNPRFFMSFEIASEISVRAGTSFNDSQLFMMGFPFGMKE
jgi:hypothetical protein